MLTKAEVLQGMDIVEFNTRCQYDFKFFCERLLGLDGYGGIHPYQLEWFKLIRDNDRVLIQSAAGFSKTTIFEAIALWIAWNNIGKKIMIVANTDAKSKEITNEISNFTNHNEIINELKPKDYRETWNKSELKTTTNCRIFCKPYTENMRGSRADFILLDEADSKPYRKISIFYEHVLTRLNPGGKVALISTPESATGLMSHIREKDRIKKDYIFKKYPAIINIKTPGDYFSGESIWPERFPISELKKRFSAGNEYSFKKLYLCDEKAESDESIFRTKYILDCFNNNEKLSVRPTGGFVVMACDFAYSSGPRADFDAYTIIEKKNTFFTIRHIEIWKGVPVPVKVSRIQELCEEYEPNMIVCDKSNIGSAVIDELISRGIPVQEQGFSHIERKDLLMTLKGVIENKKLVIPRYVDDSSELKLTDELVAQLVGFVKRESESSNLELIDSTYTHDDIAISVAMAVKALTKQISGEFFEDEDKKFINEKNKNSIEMLNKNFMNSNDIDNRVEWDWNKI